MSAKAVASEPVRSLPSAVRLTPARSSLLQRATCSCGKPIVDGGECTECAQKRLQRTASNHAPATGGVPSSVHSTLQSPGTALDSQTRSSMESRFGHDFSQVRVHNDATAAQSAHEVGARAYTVGQDIVFGSGHYAPHSEPGQHLLAHELAHTIQQHGLQCAPDRISVDQGPEYQRLEREAESAAATAMQGQPVSLMRPAARPTLSKAKGSPAQPASPATATPKSKNAQPASTPVGSVPVTVSTPSYFGTTKHQVTPEAGTKAGAATEESFVVDPLYIPATKGMDAFARFQDVTAGGALQAVLEMNGTSVVRIAGWQLRDPTPTLRDTWLQARGLKADAVADKVWVEAGGKGSFPTCATGVCQIDHILELQSGGGNNAENLQPLDGVQNSDSGRALWNEVSNLASAIAETKKLSSGKANQLRVRFSRVEQKNTTVKADKGTAVAGKGGIKKGTTCLSIGQALTDNLQSGASKLSAAAAKTADKTLPYNITARGKGATTGGSDTTIQVENIPLKKDADIFDDSRNEGAGQLISGLLLKKLKKGAGPKSGKIEGTLDTRSSGKKKTRLPISLTSAGNLIHLNVGPQSDGGVLRLDKPSAGLQFTYPFLSPGRIKTLSLNADGGTDWTGEITPTVPFLGKLDVEYTNDELKVVKGIDEAALKKRSFLGARITAAQVSVALSPEFKPEGRIDFQLGSAKAPVMTGYVTLGKDDVGMVAQGKFKLNIPKVDSAEFDVAYRAGGDRHEWDASFKIESTQIKLPYVKGGSLDGRIKGGQIDFGGKIDLELPGGSTAEVSLQRYGEEWIFSGNGLLKIPKLDETRLGITYNTRTETVTATGSTGFTIHSIGLKGHLEKLTLVAKKGEAPKVSGTGSMEIKKGKANGSAKVTLNENGKFSGKGTIGYQFTENLAAQADVELDEKEKLHVVGTLTIKRFELFKGYHDSKDLFNLDLTIPIPGLSVAGIGINAVIGGGVSAGYEFGPGVIEPLVFSAGFDPLEADPNLDLAVTGQVKIPASASVTANIHAGIEISVAVASLQGGIQLNGTIMLKGGLNMPFSARYHDKKFEAKLNPEIDVALLLKLGLVAYVIAQAGWGWFSVSTRKDWTLAEKNIDTGLRFQLGAPFAYDSDKGISLPSAEQVTLKKPDIDIGNLLSRIFGQSDGVEKEV